MKSSHVRWLVAAAVLAVVVEAVDTVGWVAWRRTARALAAEPGEGAVRVASDPLLALPSAVARSRRLAARDLGLAARELVLPALARIGTRQMSWFPADPHGWLNKAREAVLEDRADEAADSLEQATIRDPMSPHVRRLTALVLLHLGRVNEAMENLAYAEGIAPGLASPQVELTEESAARVRLEGLRLRRILYPRNPVETTLALARELRARGDEAEGRKELAPLRGQPEVELELARWAIEKKNYGKALVLLEGPANRDSYPRSLRARAWSLVATARELSGDPEGALAAARTALRLAPESPAPYVTLAGLARARGDLEGAFEYLRRARGMAPSDTDLLLRLAVVAEEAGRRPEAIAALQRAVELDPQSVELAIRLIDLQLRAGDYAAAAMRLSEALDRFPTEPRLLLRAQELRNQLGLS